MVLGGPLPHVMAAKAIAFREANTPAFCRYAQDIVNNAKTLADALMKKGVRLILGGTENHLMILDLSKFGLTGRHAETALREAHMTANRNAIPFDTNGAWCCWRYRIGTPAMTTLGMGADEMRQIADMIVDVLSHTKPDIVEKTGQSSKAKCTTDVKVKAKVQGQATGLLFKEVPVISRTSAVI